VAYKTRFIQFVLEYDNPKYPFAETSSRMRFFATMVELEEFMEKMDPDERVLKAFRQTTDIGREYFIGYST